MKKRAVSKCGNLGAENVQQMAKPPKETSKLKAGRATTSVSEPPKKPCVFDMLRVKPAFSPKQILIVKINKHLNDLRACCTVSTKDVLPLPTLEKLHDLDTAVTDLATQFRVRKKPRSLRECYEIVDQQVSSWKLLKTVRNLLVRAQKNIPPRPLEVFVQLARRKPDTSASVSRLLSAIKEFKSKSPPITEEQWRDHRDDFCDVLLKHLPSQTSAKWKEFGSLFWEICDKKKPTEELESMRKFVELAQEDRLWEGRYERSANRLWIWVACDLKNEDFLGLLDRFILPGFSAHEKDTPEHIREWIYTARKQSVDEHNLKMARLRQNRHRKKSKIA